MVSQGGTANHPSDLAVYVRCRQLGLVPSGLVSAHLRSKRSKQFFSGSVLTTVSGFYHLSQGRVNGEMAGWQWMTVCLSIISFIASGRYTSITDQGTHSLGDRPCPVVPPRFSNPCSMGFRRGQSQVCGTSPTERSRYQAEDVP